MLNTLTKQDIANIQHWIQTNEERPDAPMEKILSYWSENKPYLYNLFGQKLILTKTVEFSKSVSELADEMDKFVYQDAVAYQFYQDITKIFQVEDMWRDSNRDRRHTYHGVCSLFHSYVLAENRCDRYVEIPLGDGSVLKLQEGTKPVRALKRIAESYGVANFEYFRIGHSRILNHKKLRGSLNLSIHPLDYMTMSDNNCHWSSCMSWTDGGGYRRGTVEMMNSSCVVVAYLTAETPYTLPNGEEWNNKKWRSLFIVTPKIISSVKGYPYQHEELAITTLNWLAELANTNANGDFNTVELKQFDHSIVNIDGHAVRFYTEAMYNDFGSATSYALLSNDLEEKEEITVNYSGPANCMVCGRIASFPDEGALVCEICHPVERCCRCDEAIYDGENCYWVGDELYCSYCYDEYIQTCPVTGNQFDCDDSNQCKTLILMEDKKYINYTADDFQEEFGHWRLWASITIEYDADRSYHWKQYFTQPPVRVNTNRWCETYAVFIDECTEDGLELFDEEYEDTESYIKGIDEYRLKH